MLKYMWLFIFILCTSTYVEAAKKAKAMVTLKIVNQDGLPVSNVYTRVGFYTGGDNRGNMMEGTPDVNGIFHAEGVSSYDCLCVVGALSGGKYYRSRTNYVFTGREGIVNGKWEPWNPLINMTVKRKVNPVAMCVKPYQDGVLPPVQNKFIGFDLEKGAWVQPYGLGANADILLKYEYEAGKIPLLHYRGAVFFSFTNKFDGAYVKKKDNFSNFMSVYKADTHATYQQSFAFIYDRLTGTIVENSKFSESEYLVLRVRSKVDANGDLITAHYAKIYGPIAAGRGGIYFGFYFNPNANDPNLEADPTRNLLNPRDLGFPP